MPVRIFRLALALVCALLAGCASMNGLAPETTSRNANTLASAQSLSDTKVDAAAWPSTDWWKAFGDPQLDRLIDEALAADSPTLAVAAARMRKALALAQQSQSALSPRLDASASTTRERFPEHGLIPP